MKHVRIQTNVGTVQERDIPTTIDEAVDVVIGWLGVEGGFSQLADMAAAGRDIDQMVTEAHHGISRHVRNNFCLWLPDGAELRAAIWEAIGAEKQAFYDAHWKRYGDVDAGGESKFRGATMHADDASSELMGIIIRRLATLATPKIREDLGTLAEEKETDG